MLTLGCAGVECVSCLPSLSWNEATGTVLCGCQNKHISKLTMKVLTDPVCLVSGCAWGGHGDEC